MNIPLYNGKEELIACITGCELSDKPTTSWFELSKLCKEQKFNG